MPADQGPSFGPRVLLIGWDAAEWKVICPLADRGLLPNLSRLMARGECGNLAGGFPLLSPTRWTSIVTGKHPTVHGILGSVELDSSGKSLVPIGRGASNSAPIWSILDRAGIACHAINFPATHPAQRLGGISISNRFFDNSADADAAWPRRCAAALRELRLTAEQIDVATVRTFVPQATDEECRRDPHIRQIAGIVAHAATVHAAATWAMQNVPWQFAAICCTGLHQFSHGFMRYHPPRLPGIGGEDFERFGGVIAAAYRFHDMMLGRLIELAGPEARVVLVSDHGFHCDHLRPAVAAPSEQSMLAWHRPGGVSVMAGPGIPVTQRVRPLSIFNIAPTILGWFGQRMDDAAASLPAAEPPGFIAGGGTPGSSAENATTAAPAPGYEGTHALDAPEDEAVAFLKRLGYAESPDARAEFAAGRLADRRRFHLAVAWLDAGRPRRAAPMLEELVKKSPGELEYCIALGHAYAADRRTGDCRRLVDEFLRDYPASAAAEAAAGILEIAARRAAAAVAHLQKAEQFGIPSAGLCAEVGRAYLRLRKFVDAHRAFSRAIQLDPDLAPAHGGVATALLGIGDASAAVEASARAIGLQPDDAMLHYGHGLALAQLGKWTEAKSALLAAVEIDSQCVPAMHKLGDVCDRLGDLTAARQYDRQAHLASAQRRLAEFQAAYTARPSR